MKRMIPLLYSLLVVPFFISHTQAETTPVPTEKKCPETKIEVERLPDMNIPRAGHNTFCIGDEIVVIGGHTKGFVPTATAEYYKDGKWHLMNTVYEHDNGLAVMLKSGKVLLAGGHEKALGIGQTFPVEMYDPENHTFDGFGCLDTKRTLATGASLDNGKVVISGNWYHEDAIEYFDGQQSFSLAKKSTLYRARPYVFPISDDDALIFGSNNERGIVYDTIIVDRLQGDSFHVPLLDEWKPIRYEAEINIEKSFIGDKAKDIYAYLFPVMNKDGQMAIAKVQGTEFSLLPTNCVIPMKSQWGKINYFSPVYVNGAVGKCYVVGCDDDGRRYVLSIDYKSTDQDGCPLRLYYTEPLEKNYSTHLAINADGNLVMTGGIYNSNFNPFSSAYILHLNNNLVPTRQAKNRWIWILVALLLLLLIAFCFLRKRKKEPKTAHSIEENKTSYSELMQRMCTLMEEKKPFLQADLKVSDIAELLQTNSRTISECIKQEKDCSFSTFVNGYRIEYAKSIMTNKSAEKMSSIFAASGFSNERSFFRSFKLYTGLTPKEWASKYIGEQD